MLKATQPATIQSAILKAGIFTDKVVSNGTLTNGSEKRKSVDEPAKVGGSGRDVKKAKGGTNFVAAAPSREGYVASVVDRSIGTNNPHQNLWSQVDHGAFNI
ncbi:hypothetical protein Tco_0207975 [Tanacetum coccineum]